MSLTYQYKSYLDFIENVPVPKEDLEFFSKIPWTNEYLNSNDYKSIPFLSRFEKQDSSDQFFNRIIKTHDTIPHLLALMRKSPWNSKSSGPENPDFITLFELGSGLNGFKDTVHGGVLSSLFDEPMGLCIEGIREMTSKTTETIFTAYLNVSYRLPVKTPSIMIMKVWLESKEGRKWFIKGQLIGEDGKVTTDASGLWITMRNSAGL